MILNLNISPEDEWLFFCPRCGNDGMDVDNIIFMDEYQGAVFYCNQCDDAVRFHRFAKPVQPLAQADDR